MADERTPIALISLFATDEEEPAAEGNFKLEALPGTYEGEFIPFDEWEEWEKEQFPKANGEPDPTVVLLQIVSEQNSATRICWWVKTSSGKIRVCYP